MPALVAIEVSLPCAPSSAQPSDQAATGDGQQDCAPPDIASMLEACNAALHPGACVEARPGVHVPQFAQVSVDSPTAVRVEVTSPRRDLDAPTVRVLEFSAADEPREKWRTVGFTTALVVEGRVEPARPSPAPKLETEESRQYVALATARLVGASGFGVRSPKAGGHVQIAARARQAPLFVGVSAEYTTSAWTTKGIDGDATWSELGVGVSTAVDLADELELFIHVSGLAQRLALNGQKKAEVAEVSLWQPGLRCGLDLAWPVYARWYGVLGAHATGVIAPVELRAEGEQVARVPAVGGGVTIGIQYRF